jgi:ABC-type glycerol-3-phosphate transport system permease component
VVGETNAGRFAKHAILIVLVLVMLFPVYWMINMSLKTKSEFVARPPSLVVDDPTTENYRDLLVTQRFDRFGLN